MGLLYGTHMGPIWATRIWANPYGTHAEPVCTPHMGSPYGTHIGSPTDFTDSLLRTVGQPTVFGTPLVVRQRIKYSMSTA